jgi:hypothetical protein
MPLTQHGLGRTMAAVAATGGDGGWHCARSVKHRLQRHQQDLATFNAIAQAQHHWRQA